MDTPASGIIATNTTVKRPMKTELTRGGLSGRPLTDMAAERLRWCGEILDGELPLIGVGGIMNAADAYQRLALGANLVQVYTGFVYGGPWFCTQLQRGLLQMMDNNGMKQLSEVIGSQLP